MKGILKRLTLVTLVLAMAMTLMAGPSMAGSSMTEDEQISEVYGYIFEREATALGRFQTWPLEEKAAFSDWVRHLAEQGNEVAKRELSTGVYSVPGKDNMTLEEATELTRQGIIAKYGVEEEALVGNTYVEAAFYTRFFDYEAPHWQIGFQIKGVGNFYVEIVDRTKEITIWGPGESVG